jgi:RNA polymerase sigma factor (sigma-70 family)
MSWGTWCSGPPPPTRHPWTAGELAQQMELAFDRLPDDYREVITLARIVGLSHAEIARQMGRGEGAVRMLLSRALVAYVAAMDQVRGRR